MLKKPYKIFFTTLANNKRLEIINLLRKGEKNVTQISEELGFDQTTVSHNLKRLELCKFISVRINGKERIYSLNKETIEPLIKLIDLHTEKYCKELCGCKETRLTQLVRVSRR